MHLSSSGSRANLPASQILQGAEVLVPDLRLQPQVSNFSFAFPSFALGLVLLPLEWDSAGAQLTAVLKNRTNHEVFGDDSSCQLCHLL